MEELAGCVEDMTLDLYLIRHGQSVCNTQSEYVWGRSNDTPLTCLGEEQGRLLGRFLSRRSIRFDRVYASRAVRAYKTAESTCREIEFPLENIVLCDELLELDQGEWTGKLRVNVYTPETLNVINQSNGHFRPQGGESQRDVEQRVYKWVDKTFISSSQNSVVGVFGHGVTLKCLLRRILDATSLMTHKICIGNTGVTKLQYTAQGWHVCYMNSLSHLPLHLQT